MGWRVYKGTWTKHIQTYQTCICMPVQCAHKDGRARANIRSQTRLAEQPRSDAIISMTSFLSWTWMSYNVQFQRRQLTLRTDETEFNEGYTTKITITLEDRLQGSNVERRRKNSNAGRDIEGSGFRWRSSVILDPVAATEPNINPTCAPKPVFRKSLKRKVCSS